MSVMIVPYRLSGHRLAMVIVEQHDKTWRAVRHCDAAYLLGDSVPRYPVPATFGDCLTNHTQWLVWQRLQTFFR
jgi:hypothetical protein